MGDSGRATSPIPEGARPPLCLTKMVLQRSNFYVADFPPQRASWSFKELSGLVLFTLTIWNPPRLVPEGERLEVAFLVALYQRLITNNQDRNPNT